MSEQTRLFLQTIAAGFAIGWIFDVFRVLRAAVKHPDFLTQIEDMLYWVIVSFGMFYFLLNVNAGEVRIFSIIGAFLGMGLYFATLSPVFMAVSVAIVDFVKKVVVTTITIMLFPIKILLRILAVPARFARKKAKQAGKPVKKLLQNSARYAKMKKQKFVSHLWIMFKKV